MSRNLGALTLLDPSGPAWPVMGVLYLTHTLVLHVHMYVHVPVTVLTLDNGPSRAKIGRFNNDFW
jgi:hypothetical protein